MADPAAAAAANAPSQALRSRAPADDRRWGSREWFGRLWRSQGVDDPAAYFSRNGYQLHRQRSLLAFLRRRWRGRAGALLDVGCGTGALTREIAESFDFERAVGMDFVPDLIEAAQRCSPGLELVVARLPEIPFPEASFDLVVASEVLYYLDAAGRERAAAEIRRVLRPGGHLLFSTALGPAYFTEASARALLEPRLEIRAAEHGNHWLYHRVAGPLALCRRLESCLRGESEPGTLESAARLERHARLLRHPFARGLLRSRVLPAGLDLSCRLLLPRWTRTNLSLLARKPAAPAEPPAPGGRPLA
jgi:ubiquinone/menaquinone biosynthesis C-methylase UbiE